MDDIELSIIIVSYNEEAYIRDALESCLTQKCNFSYEIIVGDDGSSDGTLPILDEYKRRYPEIFSYFVMERSNLSQMIPSLRVSNVIKAGFQRARGTYLMVMSADDVLIRDDKFQSQVDFLEGNKKFIACCTDFDLFWPDGRNQTVRMRSSLSRISFWATQYVHISCFIFSRSVIANVLDRFCDDTGLIFSIMVTGKCSHLPVVAFGYRQRDKSIMASTDSLGLYVLELLVLQDALNSGHFCSASWARSAVALKYVFEHRKMLGDEKYERYFYHGGFKDNNYLQKIADYNQLPVLNRIPIKCVLYRALLYKLLFRIIRKIDIVWHMFLERKVKKPLSRTWAKHFIAY